jgi:chemotaxis protein MotB
MTQDRWTHHDRRTRAVNDVVRAGRDRWLISYADLTTLLFACFMCAYAALAASVPPEPAPAPDRHTMPVVHVTPVAEERVEAPRALRELLEPIVVAAVGQVELVDDRRGLVISLPESATFATGSAELTPEARDILGRLSNVLQSTATHVRVEGHTDDVPLAGGRYRTNWELSTARASAVVLYLVSDTAFPPERLAAAGYGEFRPRVANDTPENRTRNRRVDLVVIGHEESTP